MIAALLDHLWQSTLFAGAICLVMPLFRGNSAAIRFWLWFAASIKFLIPVSLLTIVGSHLPPSAVPAIPVRFVSVLRPVTVPFSQDAAAPVLPAVPHLALIDLMAAIWLLGTILVLLRWLSRSLYLRAQLRKAADLPVETVVPVKAAPCALEPGLVGIWRPVILLPHGISENLTAKEMEAVMAHELCHLRRRDNLLAALHMLVEAVFWFHPLVWWLGGRLVEEREQGCDESVLAAGNQPLVYAEGILKICRIYIQSPLACAPGASGAALETRVGMILRNGAVEEMGLAKRGLLLLGAAMSIILPLLTGRIESVTAIADRVATAIVIQTVDVHTPLAAAAGVRILPKSAVHRARRHVALVAPAVTETTVPGPVAMANEPSPLAVPEAGGGQISTGNAATVLIDDSTDVVCRLPQPIPGSRLSGPRVCRSKGEWAELRRQGKDIGADGHTLVYADNGKYRPAYAQPCIQTFAPTYSNTGIKCF